MSNNTFRILNIGDSVPWGQGLLESAKYDALIRDALRTTHLTVTLDRLAHSGAVTGAHPASGGPAPGEVPVAKPTVIDQCDAFNQSPETIDLVLVNGGINDVGVANIVNPFAVIPTLSSRIESACKDRMIVVLKRIAAKFVKPSCRILVTGYYPLLSKQSDPLGLNRVIEMYGIRKPSFMAQAEIAPVIIARCKQFFDESEQHLKSAVRQVNDPRIQFVSSGFTDANAMFVPGTAMLWGLDQLFGPEDPIARERAPQCDLTFPGPLEFPQRELCHRASTGHPNVAGSIQYKKQILKVLQAT